MPDLPAQRRAIAVRSIRRFPKGSPRVPTRVCLMDLPPEGGGGGEAAGDQAAARSRPTQSPSNLPRWEGEAMRDVL